MEYEVEKARELEKELKRDILCPIALDDSWKNCDWPERLINQVLKYNIIDFSNWRNENSFRKEYKKLLDGLDLFYNKKI